MPKRKEHRFSDGIEEKHCGTCDTWKHLNLFCSDKYKWDKVHWQCKSCRNNRLKQRHANFTVEERKNFNAQQRKRRANFTPEQRENYLAQMRIRDKAYQSSGRRNYVVSLRRKNDPKYAISCRLRSRLRHALKSKGIKKSKSTMELCGCTLDELIAHLEKQFVEDMSWDNRSEWHVDHIRPCASFDLTDIEQQKQCFHFTNLQPLWAADNLKKGAKWSP